MQRGDLSLLHWQFHQSVFHVDIEKLYRVFRTLRWHPELVECPLFCALPAVLVAHAVARDNRDPRGHVVDGILWRLREIAENRVLHSICSALSITGDEPDGRDNTWVLVRDESLKVQLDLLLHLSAHETMTREGGSKVDNNFYEFWLLGHSATQKVGDHRRNTDWSGLKVVWRKEAR
jgi:hypothetical protein